MRSAFRRSRVQLVSALLLVGALALVGCSNPSDQQRIEELENQVAELQASQDGNASNTTSNNQQSTQDDQGATQNSSANSSGAAQQSTSDALADFDARIGELESTCQNTAASGDRDADYQTYLDIQSEIDALDREIDAFENEREREARDGTLSREEFREIDRETDRLEDRLDNAEDTLEYNMRIDD